MAADQDPPVDVVIDELDPPRLRRGGDSVFAELRAGIELAGRGGPSPAQLARMERALGLSSTPAGETAASRSPGAQSSGGAVPQHVEMRDPRPVTAEGHGPTVEQHLRAKRLDRRPDAGANDVVLAGLWTQRSLALGARVHEVAGQGQA